MITNKADYKQLLGLAYKLSNRDIVLAEDMVQMGILAALENQDKIKSINDFKGYVCRVMKNIRVDRHKQRTIEKGNEYSVECSFFIKHNCIKTLVQELDIDYVSKKLRPFYKLITENKLDNFDESSQTLCSEFNLGRRNYDLHVAEIRKAFQNYLFTNKKISTSKLL